MPKTTLKNLLFISYLFILIWILLLKMSSSVSQIMELSNTIRNINLIPFKESMIINGTISYREILYNFLIFIPFGGLLGMIDKKHSLSVKGLFLLFFSLIIETLQFIFGLGATDITDLLANTMGGILGLLCYQLLNYFFIEDNLDKFLTRLGTILFCVSLTFIIFILLLNRLG